MARLRPLPFVLQLGRREPEVPWLVARDRCRVRRTVHTAAQRRSLRERNAPVLQRPGRQVHQVVARRDFEPEFSAIRSATRPRSDSDFPRFGCER
jgi:hypothetical protein